MNLKYLMALCAGLCLALPSHADGLSSLAQYMKTVRSGRTEFTQVVTTPAREERPARKKTSSGRFEFQRPNRFRFHYAKPFEQIIVADGTTLWLYDADLNQVTARRQADTLDATPAALIASAADLQALQASFELANGPDRDGLQWVVATPRQRDGQLQSIRVGLRTEAGVTEIAMLEILDNFGQLSVLRFARVEINVALPPGLFHFTPPKGADVIRQ